jgi:hypothetical protein
LPTSTRSIGFCVIWACNSPSSSSSVQFWTWRTRTREQTKTHMAKTPVLRVELGCECTRRQLKYQSSSAAILALLRADFSFEKPGGVVSSLSFIWATVPDVSTRKSTAPRSGVISPVLCCFRAEKQQMFFGSPIERSSHKRPCPL